MGGNQEIPDIKQRLTLFQLFFGFSKNEDWLELLGYSDETSVSRVKNGKQKISEKAIQNICKASGIKRSQFRLPLLELAELLDVTDEGDITEIVGGAYSPFANPPDDLHASDKAVLEKLPGSYILLYPGREEKHINSNQIIIEKFEIFPAGSRHFCRIIQKNNVITGERAEGELRCRGATVYFNLSYKNSYYPESSFLLHPVLIESDIKILSGLYLDVAPLSYLQIFSTQCCMFSVPDHDVFPRRFSMDHELFEVWNKILDNKTEYRRRLISKSGDDFYERVRYAALRTIEEGER